MDTLELSLLVIVIASVFGFIAALVYYFQDVFGNNSTGEDEEILEEVRNVRVDNDMEEDSNTVPVIIGTVLIIFVLFILYLIL